MTEHNAGTMKLALEHFDMMRLVDKMKVIDAIRPVLDDPDKTIDTLVKLLYDARVSAYKLGRPELEGDDAEKIN